MPVAAPGPVPVTVLGGFLGAGKTTLLNHVLSGDHGLRIAVMVNDFGAINVDAALVESAEGGMLSMSNGCVCCSLNQGLVDNLNELLAWPASFDHIVIEASGVADPGRIMDTVRHARFALRLRADAIVVLVDAAGFDTALDIAPGLAHCQIGAADLLVLNKIDLVDPSAVRDWRDRWCPPDARIVETVNAVVAFDILFAGPMPPRPGRDAPVLRRDPETPRSICWSATGPVDLGAVQSVLRDLPTSIFRAKGILHGADGRVSALHLVGSRLSFTPLASAPKGYDTGSVIALIGFAPGKKAADPDLAAILARLDTCKIVGTPPAV